MVSPFILFNLSTEDRAFFARSYRLMGWINWFPVQGEVWAVMKPIFPDGATQELAHPSAKPDPSL